MTSMKQLQLRVLAVLVLLSALLVLPAWADIVKYVYDDLNRLVRMEYSDGTGILYNYDEVGNRTQKIVGQIAAPVGTESINGGAEFVNGTSVTLTLTCTDSNGCSQMRFSNDGVTYSTPEAYSATKTWTLPSGDGIKRVYVKLKDSLGNWSEAYTDTILLDTTGPATIPSLLGGTYNSAKSVSLSCIDVDGSGCDQIYYTLDGSTPTTASPVYANPIAITATTTLKYFAKDMAGWCEGVKTQIYVINTSMTTDGIRIAGATPVYYESLQAAYGAATDGAVIQVKGIYLSQNLSVSRDISVTLDGGYNDDFSGLSDNMTLLSGTIVTQPGGRPLTINNVTLTSLVDIAVPDTTSSLASATFKDARWITLTCNDGEGAGCDRIYYTIDGSTPTMASFVYTGPIHITATTTLKYFAKDLAGRSETVKSQI